jgi:hypothetical protein
MTRTLAHVQGATVLVGYCMSRESMRLDLLEVGTAECRKEGGLGLSQTREAIARTQGE